MKLKTLAFCVAVLALLSIGAYLATRPEAAPPADPRIGQPLLDPAVAASVAKIVLTDQGKTVTLTRQADGTWLVPSYYGLPADFSKVSRLVSDLNESKLDRFVTSSPERLARLEFKDTEIQLYDGTGKEVWNLFLGKMAATGNSRFVRFGTEPKAFATGLQASVDADGKNWADAQLLALKVDDIQSIQVPLESGGSVTLTRKKKEDPWTSSDAPDHRKVKGDAVTSLLAGLSGLRFTDTTGLDDPARKEAQKFFRTTTLTTFDGKTVRIALGRRPEEKKLKAPVADAKGGPASLGKASDAQPGAEAAPGAPKPGAPEYDTIAAGPVFVEVTSSDGHAPVNELMKKRAYQIEDYVYTSLPKGVDDLFEPAPPKPVAAPKAAAPAAPAAPAK